MVYSNTVTVTNIATGTVHHYTVPVLFSVLGCVLGLYLLALGVELHQKGFIFHVNAEELNSISVTTSLMLTTGHKQTDPMPVRHRRREAVNFIEVSTSQMIELENSTRVVSRFESFKNYAPVLLWSVH